MPPSDGVERAEAPIRQAVTLPLRGGIAAIPTDTVHGSAAAVFNPAAAEAKPGAALALRETRT